MEGMDFKRMQYARLLFGPLEWIETLTIRDEQLSKDGVMKIGSPSDFIHPPLVDTYMPTLQTFSLAVSTALTEILTSLSSILMLLPSDSLENSHRPYLASPDVIRLLRYAPQPLSERGSSHLAHTDLGSLTFLFTRQWGLQVLGAGEWKWVEPRAGYAIVNLGDCLSLLTNSLLKSCTHRVGPLPGRPMEERYSFAYLLRPQDETVMRAVRSPLVGMAEVAQGEEKEKEEEEEEFTCAEWIQRKFGALRANTWDEKKNWVLTGAA